MYAREERGVAQAKLAGEWPGWEWLPGVIDYASRGPAVKEQKETIEQITLEERAACLPEFDRWLAAFLQTPEGEAALRKAGL